MRKQLAGLETIILQIGLLLLLAGCAPGMTVSDEPAAAPVADSSAAAVGEHTVPATVEEKAEPACANPDEANAVRCREMEREILSATVRLEFEVYAPAAAGGFRLEDGSIGHGTIVEGRYLLTHNHFGLSLADFEDGRRRTLTVYAPDGEILLQDAPFGSFEVVVAAPQTLVFDFGDYGGEGLFGFLGLGSTRFNPEQSERLQAGMAVAQVDWDGNIAHVDWVRIDAIREEGGTRVLVLGNFVAQGASGGGVFYDGYFLANNWFRRTERTVEGELVQRYTVAALGWPASQMADALPERVATGSLPSQ